MLSDLRSPKWPYFKWETVRNDQDNLDAVDDYLSTRQTDDKELPATSYEPTQEKQSCPEKIHRRLDGEENLCSQKSMVGEILEKTARMPSHTRIGTSTVTANLTNLDEIGDGDIMSKEMKAFDNEFQDTLSLGALASEYRFPHLVGVDLSVSKDSGFTRLLEKLTSKLKIFGNEISQNITKEINSIMKNVIAELRKSNKLFDCCRLLPVGSVAEGTKVGKADEFDFLVILDSFADKNKWKLTIDRFLFRLLCKEDYSIAADDQHLFYVDENSGNIFLASDIRQILMNQFIAVFDNCLASDPFWERAKSDDEELCISDIAATLHLMSTTHGIGVDIDVCMCVPIDIYTINNTLSKSNDEQTILLFSYIKSLYESAPFEIFGIIGERSVFYPATSLRVTAPLLELSRFKFYGDSSTRVLTYRLAKSIVSTFLPKLTKIFGCKRCCHPLVRSYHLKNILFFMLTNYKDDAYWQLDKVPFRISEMFMILKYCITNKLDEVCNIATCCTPGTLRVDEIFTFNPFIPDDKERPRHHDCYFTQDSHKPVFQLSSSPRHEECINTGRPVDDAAIKEWFDHLNEEHWSSYELLPSLSQLLLGLSK